MIDLKQKTDSDCGGTDQCTCNHQVSLTPETEAIILISVN